MTDDLPPERAEILEREVARFVAAARSVGATPVFALVDFERTASTDAVVQRVRARFPDLTVIDCAPAFAGPDPGTFAVPRDSHPNAEAHRMIAKSIIAGLSELPPPRRPGKQRK